MIEEVGPEIFNENEPTWAEITAFGAWLLERETWLRRLGIYHTPEAIQLTERLYARLAVLKKRHHERHANSLDYPPDKLR